MNLFAPDTLGWWFYPITFILNVLDSFLPPLPQELFVLAIGPLTQTHQIALWPAMIIAWIANVLGDGWLAWTVARHRHRLERWRWGRWLLRKAGAGLSALGQRGSFGVLAGLRFVSGGRTASFVAAGLAGTSQRIIWAATSVGSAAWVGFMVILGQLTHNATGLPAWGSAILGMIVGTLMGAVPALIAWLRRRHGKGNTDDHTGASRRAQRGE